ncbi:hypothetical protein M153_12570001519 [Pseudoloma neurophilia]|uniref:Uncharacterized protein n=1 Tax=Pseudoloma neurophilia TaxID=146866 RepID=A0A0R0M1H3_9MICR|nr:hypothetical protein M153_12570001519 [Pseudoloma neurophilia]
MEDVDITQPEEKKSLNGDIMVGDDTNTGTGISTIPIKAEDAHIASKMANDLGVGRNEVGIGVGRNEVGGGIGRNEVGVGVPSITPGIINATAPRIMGLVGKVENPPVLF